VFSWDFKRYPRLNILDASTPAGLLLPSNMSDETVSSPENSPTAKAEAAPRVRRVSTPRPKKVAKEAAPTESAPAESAAPESAPEPVAVVAEIPSIPFPTTSRRAERPESQPQGGTDWPEPEAEAGGGSQSQSESSKRKRRRRKGKGQGQGQGNGHQNLAVEPPNEESQPADLSEPRPADAPQDQRPRPQHPPQPRAKIDPELLTKMAWKIYLAEVSEEGVALIGDNDAKDLSRRCFRLAEIFIEEQTRRC
jgi:hypothetical protein